MTTYRLTKSGRNITWAEWKKHGGCGLSSMAISVVKTGTVGPESVWKKRGVLLGDIADASVLADRELARYCIEHWAREDLAVPEQCE